MNAQMDKIIAMIGVICSFGIVTLLSIEDMSNDVKLPIVVLSVLIAGYSLTRTKPKETKSETDTGQ
jgi:hypothetical protein